MFDSGASGLAAHRVLKCFGQRVAKGSRNAGKKYSLQHSIDLSGEGDINAGKTREPMHPPHRENTERHSLGRRSLNRMIAPRVDEG